MATRISTRALLAFIEHQRFERRTSSTEVLLAASWLKSLECIKNMFRCYGGLGSEVSRNDFLDGQAPGLHLIFRDERRGYGDCCACFWERDALLSWAEVVQPTRQTV